MNRIAATAEVYKAAADLSDWVVWASTPEADGEVFVTTFSGPDAEIRALEYAALKYAGLQRHEPDRQQCRSSQRTSAPGDQPPIRGATLRLVR